MIEDLVYDVGMHRGEDSAFYLAKGYQVTGFEANPDLAAKCRTRFASQDRMTMIEGAISDRDEPTVPFYKHPVSVWGTTDANWAERNLVVAHSTLTRVPAVNFAETLSQTGMPLYIKIDIEGADMMCIHTLGDFDEKPQYVSIESAKTDWQELLAELSALEQLGYNRFAVVQQADIPGTEIVTNTIYGEPLRFRFEDDASGAFGTDLHGWTSRGGAEEQYRRIFRAYGRWGDKSLARKTKAGKMLMGGLDGYFGPLPGWFDTHAAQE